MAHAKSVAVDRILCTAARTSALRRERQTPTPATNVVDFNRARAEAAAPIVKTSNIGELNQMLAGSSPNP
jgi:hypothetical protein